MSETLTSNDVSLLNRFKSKAAEFSVALDKLNSVNNVPPNLQAEYSGLRSTADYIQSTIGWITSTVDSVTGFFSDFLGFDGVTSTRDYINNKPVSGMGIIPLLPVAGISAALAVMSKFIADVYLFERKVLEQKRLESTGINPSEAAKIVDKISGQSFTQNLAGIAKPVGFALGAFLLLRVAKRLLK